MARRFEVTFQRFTSCYFSYEGVTPKITPVGKGKLETYTVRALTRGEIRRLSGEYLDLGDKEILEDFKETVAELCIENYSPEMPAGRVDKLVTFVLDQSGMSLSEEPSPLIPEIENWVNTQEGKLDILALAMLPQYTLEDLWNKDAKEWVYLVKAATYIAGNLHNLNVYWYLHPEEAKKELARRDAEAKVQQTIAEQDMKNRPGRHREVSKSFSWSK